MAINPSTDLHWRFSVKTGSAGNSTAGTAAGSLGKYLSTTDLTSASTHNLFDVVSGAENAALEAEYRCIFLFNDHATLAFTNVTVFLTSQTSGGADITIALDSIAASLKASASAQAAEIATEDAVPSGVGTFGAPTSVAEAATNHTIGTLDAGKCKAIWVKRTTTNSAAITGDNVVLRVSGDTAA